MATSLSETRTATGTATAVLLATTAADGSEPAALQPWREGTLLERAIAQLSRLGVGTVRVITRPEWAHEMPVDATVCAGPDDDLRAIAEIARTGGGSLVVAHADIVAHDTALANVLRRPNQLTAALTTTRTTPALRFAPRVRERGGRLVSAGSPYHSVRRPTGAFLGVVCVSAADRPVVADVAERLAAMSPPAWEAQFERKALRWQPWSGGELHIAAARQDVASLLLTGLVRNGVYVVSAHLNRLFWARPLSEPALARADERIDRINEDRLALDSAVKSNDGFFTTFFVSPYSRFIARWAARRGLTPNQITTASLLLGVVTAAAFATGERWAMIAGAVLLQLSFTLDCVDGQLARYTRAFSKLGAWLDSIFDRTKEYAVFAGLAIGAARTGDGVWLLAGCALALQTVRHMIYVAYRDVQHRADPRQPPIEQPSDRLGAGNALDVEEGDHEAPEPGRPRPERGLGLVRAMARSPALMWPRKMIAFPIGERFAVISLTAALFTPRTTFVVLLAWGGVAAAYTFTGRVLRSLASRHTEGAGALAIYRDDGPLARLLGSDPLSRVHSRGLTPPEPALVLVGVVPLLALIGFGADSVSDPVAGAAIAWAVLWGGAASGVPPHGRLRWAVLPVLRASEYAALLWLAALAGDDAFPAAFALLAALAFRHYDLVYRMRLRGTTPPRCVGALGLGWDGRLIGGYVLLVAGALTAGFFAAAAVFGAVFLAEAVSVWIGFGRRAEEPLEFEDEEDEGV